MALRETLQAKVSEVASRHGASPALIEDLNQVLKAYVWNNPIHVGVLAIPVRAPVEKGAGYAGVLVLTRGIPPAVGKVALISGYQDANELLDQTVLREAEEELGEMAYGILADHLGVPKYVKSFMTAAGNVLDFYVAHPVPMELAQASVAAFEPNTEVTAIHVVTRANLHDMDMAFDSHTQLVQELLDGTLRY